MMYFTRASLILTCFKHVLQRCIFSILPCLGDTCSKQCRAAGYRLIRHALVDRERVSCLGDALDWYIVKCVIPFKYSTLLNWFSRSLLRDNKHAVEKEQVAKLVRAVVEVGTLRDSGARTGVIPLSETVMRAVIAVAEHADDPFRPIFIQTLAEIGIFFSICFPNDDLLQVSGH